MRIGKLALIRQKLADPVRVEQALVQVLARRRRRGPNDDSPVIAALSGAGESGGSGFTCVLGSSAHTSLSNALRAVSDANPVSAARAHRPGHPGKEHP